MITLQSDERVLGFLGRALSLELSAVQLYSTQGRLVSSWGLSEAAEHLRREAEEEMQHVERIIERMLAVGAAPAGSTLRPVRLASDLSGLLRIDQQFESDMVKFYMSAAQYCAKAGDHDNRVFFEALLKEEQQHLAELDAWLRQLQQRSVEQYQR